MITKNKNKSASWRRKIKVRAKLKRFSDRLRLSVFRSAKHISCQIIDDEKGVTLAAASDNDLLKKIKSNKSPKLTKIELAEQVGILLAEKAIKKKINKVYLDRGGYKYHGRIKALADGARKAGLII